MKELLFWSEGEGEEEWEEGEGRLKGLFGVGVDSMLFY